MTPINRQSIKKYIFPTGAYILLSIFVGIASSYYFEKQEKTSVSTETRLIGNNYQFINPLLECDNSNISRDTNLDSLKNSILENIPANGNTSVYYRDMNNGPWFGINEKEMFSPASLIKVPLMMAFLKQAESDPKLLDKEILNTVAYDPKGQNIQPEVTLAVNQSYTVRALIEQMIIYSDDISYNILNNLVSYADLVKVYNDLGIDIQKAQKDPSGNILSVKAYASFFRILFNASYLNVEMSEYALSILSRSRFKDGLVAGLPSNVVAAHKFGERQYLDTDLKQLHDCGIVYLPSKPYLLCVMTRGDDFTTLKTVIKNISRKVYDEVGQK